MTKVKYPRTFHLPYSEKSSSDDKRMVNDNCFLGKDIIASIKYDGENTTLTREAYWARSLNCADRPYRHWIKNFHSQIAHEIPEGWRICGENLFARHTIPYEDLKSFFYGFAIFDAEGVCLSWKDTLEYFQMIRINPVETFYQGIYSKEKILESFKPFKDKHEGFVIRNSKDFKDFSENVGKFVGEGFIIPDGHWTQTLLIQNKAN